MLSDSASKQGYTFTLQCYISKNYLHKCKLCLHCLSYFSTETHTNKGGRTLGLQDCMKCLHSCILYLHPLYKKNLKLSTCSYFKIITQVVLSITEK